MSLDRERLRVLIVGGGGREHALAWKAAQSARVERIFVAPGNAGTAREPRVANVGIRSDDVQGLLAFARSKRIDLTLVGPETPLVAGIVDVFQDAGLACFGPNAAAARLEGSKAFMKSFLERNGIPTARYRTYRTVAELPALRDELESRDGPVVVKADGLAAGKGVVIAQSAAEAIAAAEGMLSGRAFGAAGRSIVVEDFLEGEEASFIVMCDGGHVLPLASSQDHKRRDDADAGPNTGGMGAYSPAPIVDEAMHARVMREIIEPTMTALAADGSPYVGFLYAGLMIGSEGPRVLEYNCRLGDPETQPIMARLTSDIVELCAAALTGRLDECHAEWDRRIALGVVIAASGYPGDSRKGDPIDGMEAAAATGCKVFHAGTAERDGRIVTAGGRVLCVTALGETFGDAQARAYAGVERIRFDGMHYRRDIGYRAAARERSG
jgi:phosphoribosylamine--glycine ligase